MILELLISCNNDNNIHPSDIPNDPGNAAETLLEKFNIVPGIILKDYNTWYNYTYTNVQLSRDFIGLDTDSTRIDKTTFLNKLMTGKVAAFKIRLLQAVPVYKLYRLNSSNENIKSTIEQLASIEMKNYKMEGQQIPEFNFTDLNGNGYSTISTKGKILLLKCWFIHCIACVQEFPECNKLVDEYKDRNDVLFISLASDTKNNLKKFLDTSVFKYTVIPQMDNYMTNKLNINMYPTHLLIGRTGKIIKVTNSVEEVEPFLKKEIEKPHE
jgi:peroxiredoxin